MCIKDMAGRHFLSHKLARQMINLQQAAKGDAGVGVQGSKCSHVFRGDLTKS
jgi:hypothetical protein